MHGGDFGVGKELDLVAQLVVDLDAPVRLEGLGEVGHAQTDAGLAQRDVAVGSEARPSRCRMSLKPERLTTLASYQFIVRLVLLCPRREISSMIQFTASNLSSKNR